MTRTTIRRRRLLGAGAALAATTLAGCASTASGPSIGRVVVVGGSYGGATAARYLKLWGGNVENRFYTYDIMGNLVAETTNETLSSETRTQSWRYDAKGFHSVFRRKERPCSTNSPERRSC